MATKPSIDIRGTLLKLFPAPRIHRTPLKHPLIFGSSRETVQCEPGELLRSMGLIRYLGGASQTKYLRGDPCLWKV